MCVRSVFGAKEPSMSTDWLSLSCPRALLFSLFGACAQTEQDADSHPAGGDWLEPQGSVVRWPEFDADCREPWDGAVQVINASGDGSGFGLRVNNDRPQHWIPNPSLYVFFPAGGIGQTFPVDLASAAAGRIELSLQIGSVTFSNLNVHHGETFGQVTPHEFDASIGRVVIEFGEVSILGDDSIYAGTFICRISGTLEANLWRRAIGEPCRQDNECGGRHSGHFCDFMSLTCQAGCHQDTDCPEDSTCQERTCR